jgi:hypothetical protein
MVPEKVGREAPHLSEELGEVLLVSVRDYGRVF